MLFYSFASLEPTKATVILSDIRLPLIWKNLKVKSGRNHVLWMTSLLYHVILEQKKFAVFCLARIGCEIIDTQMKFIDKQSTEVLFTDKLTL